MIARCGRLGGFVKILLRRVKLAYVRQVPPCPGGTGRGETKAVPRPCWVGRLGQTPTLRLSWLQVGEKKILRGCLKILALCKIFRAPHAPPP